MFQTGVSCFSITLFYSTLFCCGGKANLVWFTLFYSTLLTLTDRWNDRRRNEYTRFAWAGGTFFPVVLLCCFSFWFWREMRDTIFRRIVLGSSGKQFTVLRTYLVYNTVVRLCQFFCCGGKVNFVRIPYSHDRFSKISRTFFVKK